MYHWVNEDLGRRLRLYGVTPETFAAHVRWMRAMGYRSCTLDEFLDHVAGRSILPPRTVLLTFDDGYRDNLENAGPVLEAAGFTAVIFLVVDRVGGTNAWDAKHGDAPRELVSWDEVRRHDGAVFRFEVHSRTHPRLPTLDPARAADEITGAKRRFEDELGREALCFSYPHGEFDLGVERLVREAGFRAAVTDRMGTNRPGEHPLRIRRTMVTSRDVWPTFALKVATGYGAQGLVRESVRRLRGRPEPWERSG
jgi:peptidoglycan/xylan/chitin deacetylase (PgdA/CDA1 family)